MKPADPATAPLGSGSVPLAATAWAAGPGAASAAVVQAIDELGGATPSIVLVFPDWALPSQAAFLDAAAALPDGCLVAGATSHGVFTAGGPHRAGCAAVAFGPEIEAGVGVAAGASANLRRAGRAAAEAALEGLDPRPGHGVVLLLVDPGSGDQAAAVDGAYEVVRARLPLAGGGANGPEPRVLCPQGVQADAVVAVVLSSPQPVSLAVADGCHPRGTPAIATRTAGRALLELDGRPAEQVYLEGLGADGAPPLGDEAFERLAVLHPLGQPELRGTLRLRHVIGRADGGGLACATTIPANAAVWVTEQSQDSIVDSARAAAGEASALLPGRPRAVLVFDCAARRRALDGEVDQEVAALLEGLDGQPPVLGVYTRGEIGRTRGAKGDRNHAVVVVGFR